jgi:hypothetical protein
MPTYWTRWRTRREGVIRRCNAHGMFVETPPDADVGFMMEINIVLPTRIISCTAVPRFVGASPVGEGIGFEFHVVEPGDRSAWYEYYRTILADHGRVWRG